MKAYPNPDGDSGSVTKGLIGLTLLKRKSFLVLMAVAIVSGEAWSQTETALKAFETRLNAAWTEGTESAFRSLFYTEGGDPQMLESEVRNWHRLKISNSGDYTLAVKALHTKGRPPVQHNPGDKALYEDVVKALADPALVVDGHSYQPNIELAGIAEVLVNRWKEQGPITLFLNVGYDEVKNLRLRLYKPAPKPGD